MRLAPLLRLGHAGIILAAAFLFTGQAHPQETWYDDDTGLTFVWTTAAGSFDYYNVYLSVDEGEYYLAGQTATERFVVNGTNGSSHRVKVAAVLGGFEGPFSPESDPVVCDTVAPLAPVLLEAYEVLDERTVVVKLQSAPSDINFACYQALGGQFSDWTDTAETQSFTFTVNAESQNVLEIREKDLAGNIGPEASLTIANLSADSDSDGMPNYWELMYSPVLNPNDPGDANLDSDGDEYTNYEEYLADTDPTRADSAPPDTAPPFTSGHIPTKGATGVSIDTAISLHILDAGHGVDAASIAMTVNGASVAPTITGSASDYLVSYDPPANFTYSQTVTVTVDARDLHSPPNAMAREVYSFTTMPQPDTTPPSTYGHSPAKGAVDVPISANISFHIADAGDGVERSSIAVTVNGGAVVPTITGSASDYLVSYDPPANFGYSQTITVTVDARDLHSPPNAMARETYTFTTMAKPDETPPTTSGHVPAKGASDVPVNTAISFHVTDSGDGVDKPSIVLTVNGVRATPTITGTPADYLVAYYPTAEFPYSETIAVTIDAQDLHSPPNVMARESYTFTTMPRPDNTPPSTSGHIPAKGAVDVPIDTIISLHMKDAEDGVDRSSIVLTVNGVPVTPLITGTSADYLVSYDPPANFSYKQQVTVTIDAQDLASPPNAMPKETYSFVTMPEPDSTPPSTSGHVPAKGAVDVAVGTTISLHVKDAGDGVDRDSIAIRVNGASVVPTITGTPADYAVVYDPPTDFGYSQTVTVTVEASDLHSPPNVMPTETYTFQTVPRPDNEPPQTSGHFPAKGATDVLPETPISLHITDSGEGVDRASIAMTVNGQTVTPTITGTADDYLVTYVPALRFDYEETVAVTVDAKDLNSPANVMPTDSYSFTVMPSPDTTPPTTTGHSPQRDATDVPPNTIISLHVTDQGDGVDFSSIAVTVNGSPVVPSVTGTLADCLVVYDPPVNFAYDETVIVTVDAGDLHSPPNVMNQDRYEFTIATSPDNDPAASDPDVFFYENFEDGDVGFPKWDDADNANELATGDLAIVGGNVPVSNGERVLRLGATRSFGAGLVKHFAPMDTVYCRWYARFASGLSQRDLLQFVTLTADSTGELYRVGDVCPNGYDYFRTSLDFTTALGRHSPPGAALLYTYSAGMSPKFYDADGDGNKELNWPGNEFYPIPSVLIEDDGWHCLEMMLRANTPGLADGEQAFWIDGNLAGYWSGVTWRLTDALKVNCLWLRFALPQVSLNNQVWMDNVALSRRYIGPIDGSQDDAPVVIDGLSIDAVGHTSAKITWTTNKPATSIVLYGSEEGYENVAGDTSLQTEHLLTLKKLKSGKDYLCRVASRDATGANGVTSDEMRFTTQTSTKGIFTEVWGDSADSNHPGAIRDTYITVLDLSLDGGKESPVAPANSPTLYAYTFPAGKPAAALLMKWDLSALPPTAEILEAKLCLYMCESAGDADYSMSVHQVVGVDPVIAEATGQEYRNASSWDPFSGLYNDVPLAQNNIAPPEETINVSDAIGEYKEWTITKMASGWVSSPRDNHGLLINPDPNASEGSARHFRSSSHNDPAQRPRLVITCRTDRGQKLSWEDGSFVIWTDPSVTEHYVVQSAGAPGAVWKADTGLLTAPWWQSGDLGSERIRFFRIEAKP